MCHTHTSYVWQQSPLLSHGKSRPIAELAVQVYFFNIFLFFVITFFFCNSFPASTSPDLKGCVPQAVSHVQKF
jgi:hypothetical protein